jgi:hypothetical protein
VQRRGGNQGSLGEIALVLGQALSLCRWSALADIDGVPFADAASAAAAAGHRHARLEMDRT